jgi:hypothetical protein
MKPALFLRIAAVITLLLGAGHMLGRPWTPSRDPQTAAVIEAMKSSHVHIMGFDRSYMDFYVGFGLVLGVYVVAQAALLLVLAGFDSTEPARARPIIAIFFITNVAITVLDGAYLFTLPLVMSGAVALCLGLAVATARRGSSLAAAGSERA